jgi:hypothetical protein
VSNPSGGLLTDLVSSLLHGLRSTSENLPPLLGGTGTSARWTVSLSITIKQIAYKYNIAFLLQNGTTYHIANGTALFEYLVTLYFKPSWKSFPFVSGIGECP